MITVQRLQEVKHSQPELGDRHWWQYGGYLNFLTDDRDDHYQRYYVGQSTKLTARIRTHTRAMLYGDVSTLQYYIHTLGGGYRKPNFLRLTHIEEDDITEVDERVQRDSFLKVNMLEMTMALAFNSLPRATLERYLPLNLITSYYPTIHLNVAIPLLQVKDLDFSARAHARGQMSSWADPQVRSWSLFRNEYLSGHERDTASVEASPLRSDFLRALKEAIRTVDPELDTSTFLCEDMIGTLPLGADLTIKDQISVCATNIQAESGRELQLFTPLRSLGSSIAIIFGQPSQQRGDDTSVALDQRLPPGLQDLGLSTDNSLTWPFILLKVPPTDTYDVALTAMMHRHYQEATWSILSSSLAKVVLVWGLEQRAGISVLDTEVCTKGPGRQAPYMQQR